MRARLQLLTVALSVTLAVVAFAQQPPVERPTLDALLTRAAWYLDYFVAQFENVVAETTTVAAVAGLVRGEAADSEPAWTFSSPFEYRHRLADYL